MRTAAVVILCLVFTAAGLRADERYLDFIAALQDQGYHDLAIEYIQGIRARPEVPEDVRALADYLIGKSAVAEAETRTDLSRRDDELREARRFFEKFLREHPQHEQAPEAHMELAQILVERGRVAVLRADDPANQGRRSELRQDARGLFEEARKSFTEAAARFEKDFKAFPAFIPDTEKRNREAKRAAQIHWMQAQLHLGLVEYERAQTFDKGSEGFQKTLREAIGLFESVHERYRSWLAGLYARMWQGKCYEEMGELGKAEGFYKELLEHEDKDAVLQALQRQVQFFRIIVLNKRGDYLLAADAAKKWLQEHAAQRRSEMGLGVQFEQGRALIQQAIAKDENAPERARLLDQAMDALGQVARYETLYKQQAIVLEQKVRGLAGAVGSPNFDRALALGEAAKDARNWPEAAKQYAAALAQAKPGADPEQLAYVRYVLGYARLQMRDFYEAAVLGEYVARRQPNTSVAAPAAGVALAGYAAAYNAWQTRHQEAPAFEEDRIIQLAEYVSGTWPKAAEANAARITLAELHLARGRFVQAAQAFARVAPASAEHAQAIARAGDAYWRAYNQAAAQPAGQRDPAPLAAWLDLARQNLTQAVAEQTQNIPPHAKLPTALAETELALAEVLLESGDDAAVMRLIPPLGARIAAQPELAPLELRSLIALLRACVRTNDLQAAQDAMQAIEKTRKDLAQITRVYLELGKQLQVEMDRLQARGDDATLKQARDRYVAFLNQMAGRQQGQNFVTLAWTGEAFFGLGLYDQAAGRFREIMRRALDDSAFLDLSNAQNQAALTHVKLRLASALRQQGQFAQAWELIQPLPREANPGDDPLHKPVVWNYDLILERGRVLEEWSAREPSKLKTALDHWGFWAQRMEPMAQKPPQYFEIRIHLIDCMIRKGRQATGPSEREQWYRQAERQLVFMTKTSAELGGPALKSRFKQLQDELEKQLGRTLEAAARR